MGRNEGACFEEGDGENMIRNFSDKGYQTVYPRYCKRKKKGATERTDGPEECRMKKWRAQGNNIRDVGFQKDVSRFCFYTLISMR